MQSFPITDFGPELVTSLPETQALLRAANLVVHPALSHVVLHGSRGLAPRFHPEMIRRK